MVIGRHCESCNQFLEKVKQRDFLIQVLLVSKYEAACK